MYLRGVSKPIKKCASAKEGCTNIHPPRVQLDCGTTWLEETANHCSQLWRTTSQPKGADWHILLN